MISKLLWCMRVGGDYQGAGSRHQQQRPGKRIPYQSSSTCRWRVVRRWSASSPPLVGRFTLAHYTLHSTVFSVQSALDRRTRSTRQWRSLLWQLSWSCYVLVSELWCIPMKMWSDFQVRYLIIYHLCVI